VSQEPLSEGYLVPAGEIPISHRFRHAITVALRLEADGQEDRFQDGISTLAHAVERLLEEPRHAAVVADVTADFCRSLPPSRAGEIQRLYIAMAKGAGSFVRYGQSETLFYHLATAPLPIATRASLLVAVLPKSNSYPWRFQDWQNESDRELSKQYLHDLGDRIPPATWLYRLAKQDATVRRILVAQVDSEQRLNRGEDDDARGEATVGSACSAVLFALGEEDFSAVADDLVGHGSAEANSIIKRLASSCPADAIPWALWGLEHGDGVLAAACALEGAANQITGEDRERAISLLEKHLHSDGRTVIKVARTLRAIDRTNVPAWDALIGEIELHEWDFGDGFPLLPIPSERIGKAVDIVRARLSVKRHLMVKGHDGLAAEQRLLAGVIEEHLDAIKDKSTNDPDLELMARRIGEILCHKVNQLSDERYLPWQVLAARVAREGPDGARNRLARSDALSPVHSSVALSVIREEILAHIGRDGIYVVVDVLGKGGADPHAAIAMFERIRPLCACYADRCAFVSWKDWRLGEALLSYWSSLPGEALTPIASEALGISWENDHDWLTRKHRMDNLPFKAHFGSDPATCPQDLKWSIRCSAESRSY
jgi:hypothetical protein